MLIIFPTISIVWLAYLAVAEIGGRFGPNRTTSSRAQSTRTEVLKWFDSSWAAWATGDDSLAPKAPPWARGLAGNWPGLHQDASGSKYAGSTQPVASRAPPLGSGAKAKGADAARVVRRPGIFSDLARADLTESATTQSIPAA